MKRQRSIMDFPGKQPTLRGGYRGGAKGARAPPPGQGCPSKSHKKCPSWGTFYAESAPERGTFYEESAPAAAHIAEIVPRVPGGTYFMEKVRQQDLLRKMYPVS